MQYEVKDGESVYDVTVKLYGSVAYCVELCNDNGISLDSDIEHLILTYDAAVKDKVNPEFRINTITQPPNREYFIKERQSVCDLALMFGYGIERVTEFSNLYGWNLDTLDISGQTILVTKIKTKLSQFVNLNGISFATNIE